jgi:glycosyltransferase involved in cell wall biosynthesis
MTQNKPIRVLHSFGSLGKGGIETWLMNILRLQPTELQFDFFLGVLGGAYEAEARSYGCRIHHAPPIRQLGKNLHFLEEVLASHEYDVLHIHGEEFMGDGMKVAARVGVPVRIAHSHNTQLARGKKGFEIRIRSWRHRTLDRSRIIRYATDVLACSNDAGHFLVGCRWDDDPRCKALFCGVPLDQFCDALSRWSRTYFRKAHGIPESAIVVGHAGSMGPTRQKNHPFILEVFAELARRDRRYYLYLAGDGPHRPALEQKVREMGLQPRVMMPGSCDDVPSLMVHGFDVHLLPSLWEGLPVAGLEAAASGLFTVSSDTITTDFTERLAERVKTVPLKASVTEWADEVEKAVPKRISVQEGIALVQKNHFSIRSSLSDLIEVYQHRLQADRQGTPYIRDNQ